MTGIAFLAADKLICSIFGNMVARLFKDHGKFDKICSFFNVSKVVELKFTIGIWSNPWAN